MNASIPDYKSCDILIINILFCENIHSLQLLALRIVKMAWSAYLVWCVRVG